MGIKKMKRVDYSFGGGTGSIFVAMKAKKVYFCYKAEDIKELHHLYGGTKYYSSRSGASGAGYFLPGEDDLLCINGNYRANITHLSEAWPAEMFGLKVMFPTEGILRKSPVVVSKDGILYFLNEKQAIDALSGSLPSEENINIVNYKYLTRNGEIDNFQINWIGDSLCDRRNHPGYIPYTFEEFAQIMGVIPTNIYPAEILNESVSFIQKKMHFQESEIGLARIGYFGLPVELIEGEIFPQENPRNFNSGWNTQGFGPFNFAWKRVGENGTKVYAIIETTPSKVNEKYSLLGESSMEYELLVENVLEWYNQPIEFWVEKMKNELIKKIRYSFLNSARWDQSQQIQKVRELLENNPEVVFTVEDSLEVGNCRPGTEAWMAGFGIKEPISVKKILKHKNFEEMLKNDRFRVVIINKLFEIDSEPQVWTSGGENCESDLAIQLRDAGLVK